MSLFTVPFSIWDIYLSGVQKFYTMMPNPGGSPWKCQNIHKSKGNSWIRKFSLLKIKNPCWSRECLYQVQSWVWKWTIIITLSYIIIAISLPPLGFWVLETQNKYIYFTINSFILTTFYPKHKSVSRWSIGEQRSPRTDHFDPGPI